MSELQYAALLVLLLVFGAAMISYKIGYDQGRNDGFHAGYREGTINGRDRDERLD